VWVRKLAIELGFPHLKPTDVYEDKTGRIALVNNMHLWGRSKHTAQSACVLYSETRLRRNLKSQAMPQSTAVQIADIGTKALPRIPFENFPDQLLGNKHVGDKRFSWCSHSALSKPTASAFKFSILGCVGRLLYLPFLVLLCVIILALYQGTFVTFYGI